MTANRTFTFLGTGTSVGVPMLGCDCAVCTSADTRNQRFRASVVLGVPGGNILIDTGPEMRLQLLRERIRTIHAVLYTHYHVDHLFGLDDLRIFPWRMNRPMPLYCNDETEAVIRRAFAYAFESDAAELPIGSIPKIVFERVGREPFGVLGEEFTPIPLLHGRFNVLGFRTRNVAYCTDVSAIPETSWPLLAGLDVLVLDALRFTPHPAHLSIQQALDIIAQLRPRQAYLTHMSHEIDYDIVSRTLPAGVQLAYDGLKFEY